jgi:hypothetical protein
MSPRSIRLDRDEELALFEKMLSDSISDRILLIHAQGGMGKSHLLREFVQVCHEKYIHAAMDFKAGGISIPELLSRVCDAIGWEHFGNLTKLIQQSSAGTTINITDNLLVGKNQIAIEQALNAPDEETREKQRVAVTDALFQDLRAFQKVVLIFDTFNDCDSIVAKWLSGAFLTRVCHTKNIIVVIAGRIVPEPALDWDAHCNEFVLGGIESRHFEEYAKSNGIDVHPERIKGLCDAFEGRPLPILNQLKAYSLQEHHS